VLLSLVDEPVGSGPTGGEPPKMARGQDEWLLLRPALNQVQRGLAPRAGEVARDGEVVAAKRRGGDVEDHVGLPMTASESLPNLRGLTSR